MPTYVISHLNAESPSLQHRLEQTQFEQAHDTLWLTGNLFENIPLEEVLSTFEFIRSLGNRAVTVLGEQEIKLLSVAEGFEPIDLSEQDKQRFMEILALPGSDDLLKWLRQRPLMHHDTNTNFVMVHAGIPAEWSLSQASTFATEVEIALSFGNHRALLENTQGNPPRRWNAKLLGWKRLHFIVAAFTRIKKCNNKGYMDFVLPLPANADEQDYLPWYQYVGQVSNIIFDHRSWKMEKHESNVFPLGENQVLKRLNRIG